MIFKQFLENISNIKKSKLPGQNAQFKMVPPFRQELVKRQGENIKNAKQSAVLALFYPDEKQETKFALILRNTYNGVHSAQVSFPGGKMEAEDKNHEATAIRETNEEIGVETNQIEILKELTQVYIPPSNFYVQPFLGITKLMPNFIKQENEVEELLEVALEDFLSDDSIVNQTVSAAYKVDVEVPAFKLNNHIVWGATAMILSEIKDLLKELL